MVRFSTSSNEYMSKNIEKSLALIKYEDLILFLKTYIQNHTYLSSNSFLISFLNEKYGLNQRSDLFQYKKILMYKFRFLIQEAKRFKVLINHSNKVYKIVDRTVFLQFLNEFPNRNKKKKKPKVEKKDNILKKKYFSKNTYRKCLEELYNFMSNKMVFNSNIDYSKKDLNLLDKIEEILN